MVMKLSFLVTKTAGRCFLKRFQTSSRVYGAILAADERHSCVCRFLQGGKDENVRRSRRVRGESAWEGSVTTDWKRRLIRTQLNRRLMKLHLLSSAAARYRRWR